jgi:hypothetical protein
MTIEQEILAKLRQESADAKSLFSNSGSALRERTIVAGFLRVLDIEFHEDEIIKRGPEPVDVWFRDARFQVTEILDEGRPRNREIKQRAGRITKAKSLEELIEPGLISSLPMSTDELVGLVSARAREKEQRYGGDCSGIDLLVYVNLLGRHVFPSESLPQFPKEGHACWRSVSVIVEHFGAVLWAADDAPTFLVQRREQAFRWTQGPDSVFPNLSPPKG